jgi:hypothetical protein
MSKPRKENWTVVKRVFRYFCGTTYYGISYQGIPSVDRVLDINGFVDVDWVGDMEWKSSTSGYVFNLFGGVISWMNNKQFLVALSNT